jgi:hypothetical protein
MLGQKVATLLEENLPAGYHSIDFDAGNLSSGMYIYTIKVNGYTTSKKMSLLR